MNRARSQQTKLERWLLLICNILHLPTSCKNNCERVLVTRCFPVLLKLPLRVHGSRHITFGLLLMFFIVRLSDETKLRRNHVIIRHLLWVKDKAGSSYFLSSSSAHAGSILVYFIWLMWHLRCGYQLRSKLHTCLFVFLLCSFREDVPSWYVGSVLLSYCYYQHSRTFAELFL